MHECNETTCYAWQDKRNMQNMWKPMHARGSQSIERCRDAIEPTSMDREAIEDLEEISIDPPCCREAIKIAIRGRWKARKIAKCWGGVEKLSRLLKNNFSRREKHKYECNQACNSTNDPINILDSQNHLSTIILSTKIPKTLTHTKQV